MKKAGILYDKDNDYAYSNSIDCSRDDSMNTDFDTVTDLIQGI